MMSGVWQSGWWWCLLPPNDDTSSQRCNVAKTCFISIYCVFTMSMCCILYLSGWFLLSLAPSSTTQYTYTQPLLVITSRRCYHRFFFVESTQIHTTRWWRSEWCGMGWKGYKSPAYSTELQANTFNNYIPIHTHTRSHAQAQRRLFDIDMRSHLNSSTSNELNWSIIRYRI